MTELENDIAAALARKLMDTDSVTEIVGTRIYPEVLPQGYELPAIVYSLVSETSESDLSLPAHVAEARVQFDCLASVAGESRRLKNRVREALHSQSFVSNAVDVRSVHHENTYTAYSPNIDGSDTGAYVTIIDFVAIFKES